MLILLVAHVLMAFAAPWLVSVLKRRAFIVMALAPASAAIYALTWTKRVMSGEHAVQTVEWVPGLHLDLTFRMDTLSWLMLLIVGGVGALVLVYCSAYFAPTATGLRRFGAVLVAFAGSMVGLVVSDNMLLLFVFWELTTVFSYLLIGHYAHLKASRRAAMQAIIITTAGGLAMLGGLVLIGQTTGSYLLSEVLANPPSGTFVTVAIVCILFGAASKSALLPFHFWLPAAMAAPTPVSAYLHAAAMVKAGVYLVARFAPAFSDQPVWQWLIMILGGSTLILGGYRALRQHDLKLVLAFGTVSQLGLIVLLVGLGTQSAALAGLTLLGAHALFKAALFLTTGIVDAITGTRDLRRLTGVGKRMPLTAVAGGLAVASMVGLPPFAGYLAKEGAFEAFLQDGAGADVGWLPAALVVVMVLGSILTFAYGLRFWWGAFCSKKVTTGVPNAVGELPDLSLIDPTEIKPASRMLVWPTLTLAVLGLLAGLIPSVVQGLLLPHASQYPGGTAGHLTLWGGFGLPLLLTVVVIAGGIGLFLVRDRVEALQDWLPRGVEFDRVYRRTMRLLDEIAADVTAVSQRGSLPFYLGGIFIVMTIGAATALTGVSWPKELRLWDSASQALIGVVIVAAAIAATRARRRLKAVLLVGVTGYGTAVLFMMHGAPDLALTQILAETVTLVVFVLVLRRLPAYFSNRPLRASRWFRLAVALGVGVSVAFMALMVPGVRTELPVSVNFPAEAYEFGGGTNVVNVTLVDIRAWDTMGEIAVLLAAATGVASLIFLRRRSGDILRAPVPDSAEDVSEGGLNLRRLGLALEVFPGSTRLPGVQRQSVLDRAAKSRVWLTAGRTLSPGRRSVVFEVATRLLFHSLIVFSLFLLLSGHNAPGGGFAGGLVAGIALVIRYLAGGRYELGEAAPIHPGLLLGTGLFLSVGAGLIPLAFGGLPLQSFIVETTLPVLGHIKLVTTVFFDIGVYLLVIGLVLDLLRSLGAEIDRHIDTELVADSELDDDAFVHRTETLASSMGAPGMGSMTAGRRPKPKMGPGSGRQT